MGEVDRATVPEVAVDENCDAEPWQDQIRRTTGRQAPVQAKSGAGTVQRAAKQHLRHGVLGRSAT
jgi:hypothetical protein